MREWVSLNGCLMPADEARVSVFDAGLAQGVGLFETMRAYGGKIFRLQRHLDRLVNSAAALGWTVLPNADELGDNVQQAVQATFDGNARVRLTVTTGSLRDLENATPGLTVVASASPGMAYPDECYVQGISTIVSKYRQSRFDPTVGHKTTSYFARLTSLRAAHAVGALEALWCTHENLLAEGAISSVFLVRNEQVLTPPLDTPILPGITRAAVIELAAQRRIPVHEQTLTIDDLLAADEVFITNSMMELMPVVRIERHAVGLEKPGDMTRKLAVAYSDLVKEECA